jgi:hypothetical protein
MIARLGCDAEYADWSDWTAAERPKIMYSFVLWRYSKTVTVW